MRILFVLLLAFSFKAHGACFYSVKINPVQILDGDTVKNVKFNLDFGISVVRTIRLYGINTPELRGGTNYSKRKAVKARNRLRTIVANCSKLRIILHGTGSFGRSLASLFCGNINIQDQLLKEGHAKPFYK